MTLYEVVSYDSISDLSQYSMVIFFGGIYARTIRGLKETVAMLNQDTQLSIVTVGLSNPKTSRVERERNQLVQSIIPGDVLSRTTKIHLRGAIDYPNLSLWHRFIMFFVYVKSKSVNNAKRDQDINQMIETYNQTVSFIDYKELEGIKAQLGIQ